MKTTRANLKFAFKPECTGSTRAIACADRRPRRPVFPSPPDGNVVGEGAGHRTRGRVRSPKEKNSGQSAFTMIEIAIAIGVIGFALVAIIGILPAGLNVQKESHQDSTISQDGPFFLEAIRNGGPTNGPGTSTSLDFLTNYIESITITNTYITNNTVFTNIITSNNPSSGQIILGMLSTPKYPAEVTNYLSLALATNLPGP